MRQTLIALVALALVVGCQQKSTDTSSSAPQSAISQQALTPEQLGEIGAQIHRHPSDAQKILADHHITPDAFEKAIRDVAQNPDASRRYRDAYKKSG